MQDILFLLNDDQYEDEIVETLKQGEYIYHRASNNDELIKVVRQDSIDLVITWMMDAEVVRNTLSTLAQHAMGFLPVVPVVPNTEAIEPFLTLQIADIITVPLPREEFLFILNDLIGGMQQSGEMGNTRLWEGNLEEFSLVDLIQMVESNHKDAILTVNYKGHLGQIYFRGGKVIKITLRNLTGIPALLKLASLHKAEFQIQFTRVELPDTIQNTNQELLIAILSQLSDQEKLLQDLPDVFEPLVTARIPEEESDELKTKILQMCQEGMSIHELLITLNEDNLRILQVIRELMEGEYLIPRNQLKGKPRIVQSGKGVGGLFKKISKILKRDKEESEFSETVEEQPETESPEPQQPAEPEIVYQPASIPVQTVEQIQKFLKGL